MVHYQMRNKKGLKKLDMKCRIINNKLTIHTHTHCQVAQKGNRTNLNLSKSLVAPSHEWIEEKHESTTINIRNAGKVLILKIVALNEISGQLKNNRFKTPHYAYSNR